jgi:hypothetical protein
VLCLVYRFERITRIAYFALTVAAFGDRCLPSMLALYTAYNIPASIMSRSHTIRRTLGGELGVAVAREELAVRVVRLDSRHSLVYPFHPNRDATGSIARGPFSFYLRWVQ